MSYKGKRYGVCENFDLCTNAKNGKEIEIDELDDFICPECKSELREVCHKKPFPTKIAIGVAGVCILGAVAAYIGFSGNEQLNTASTEKIATIDTSKIVPIETTTPAASVDKKDSLVTEMPKIAPENKGGKEIADNGNTPGIVKLGYAVYEGPRKNGKPHGMGGTLTFNSNYTIDLKKMPPEYVEVNKGDYIVNVKFVEGRLVQGELHFTDGTRKWINI